MDLIESERIVGKDLTMYVPSQRELALRLLVEIVGDAECDDVLSQPGLREVELVGGPLRELVIAGAHPVRTKQ